MCRIGLARRDSNLIRDAHTVISGTHGLTPHRSDGPGANWRVAHPVSMSRLAADLTQRRRQPPRYDSTYLGRDELRAAPH